MREKKTSRANRKQDTTSEYVLNRSWAEVDLDAIAHNVKEIRSNIESRTEIMGIVKADAYGHGVFEIAKTLLENGVTRLAVSMIDEAIQLRKARIKAPILILSYTEPNRASEIVKYDLTQTIFSQELAESISQQAVKAGKKVKIHIKIDTGMSRIGFTSGFSAVKDVSQISKLPGIIVEGMFTHFSKADEKDATYTENQFEKFMGICNELERIGIHIPIKHVANSATTLMYPEMQLDMVRPGIILYGLYPSEAVSREKFKLKPAMSLKSNIISLRRLEPGTLVGYGGEYQTKRESIIATIPIGYADGYLRGLGNKARVLIHGSFAPVVGRICMDQCMIDVTDLLIDKAITCQIGDEVVLFGTQEGNCIPVEELADILGTINYELVCLIGKRIPRVYKKDGKIKKVLNYLLPK